jgi:uncharacterized protein
MKKPANPVLWIVIALPLLAVAASLASLALAMSRGDPELPKDYHWEGAALDRDQERLALAARQQISATIGFDVASGLCTVTVRGAAPAALRLSLTHPVDPRLDRSFELARAQQSPAGAGYAAPCAPLPAAHWWLELSDDQQRWLLRSRAQGTLEPPARLGAADSKAPEAP